MNFLEDFLSQIQDQYVKEEETAEFTCQLTKPGLRVKWMLNGSLLTPDENIVITANDDIRTLKIKKCQLSDIGTISCHISDKSTKAKLMVEGKKEARFKKP